VSNGPNRVGRRSGGPRGPSRPASPHARLLSLQQASIEYGPPYGTLRDLVIRRLLPAVRLGESRRLWIRREDLEQLIERSTERAS
jgi:hypothetical protein